MGLFGHKNGPKSWRDDDSALAEDSSSISSTPMLANNCS